MKDKRQVIIDAAFKIFSDKGYHKAKMEEIAEEAGIGKGTIYSYFKNKQDLFDTMFLWFVENYFANLEKDFDKNDSIQLMIKKFIVNHIQIITETKATFINIMTEFSTIPRKKTEMMDFHNVFMCEKLARYEKIFKEAKNQGELRDVNTHLVAVFLLEALKGISQGIILFDHVEDGETIAKEVSDLLCYGILKQEKA